MAMHGENGKNILVAMDNSSFARKALDEAVRYAKCGHGSLTLLCVAPSLGPLCEMPPNVAKKLEGEARAVVEQALASLRDQGVDAKGYVLQGPSPAEQIVAYASEHGFDLVMLGHRGKSNLEQFIMGSVAERVAKHAPCSVWIVK